MRAQVVSLVDAAHRCGVCHSGLKSLLRSEYLERASKLPKRPVVFNSTYGEYDLSAAFQTFNRSYDDGHEAYYKVLGYGQYLCENGFGEEACTGRTHWARGSLVPADDETRTEDQSRLDGLLKAIERRTVKPLPSERDRLWEKVGLHFTPGPGAKLDVKWIPAGVAFRIEAYDGKETVVW